MDKETSEVLVRAGSVGRGVVGAPGVQTSAGKALVFSRRLVFGGNAGTGPTQVQTRTWKTGEPWAWNS